MSSIAPDAAAMPVPNETAEPLNTLRRWRRARPTRECCDLCGTPIGREHPHLFEPDQRRVSCACEACAVLFSGQTGKFRRVPRRVRALPEFRCTDEAWQSLAVPVDLVFFFRTSSDADDERPVLAFYPSPAGATEALTDLIAWQELQNAHPEVAGMEADVEALLVNRMGQSRQAYICPIDECYRLVGLVRAHWRGLSGGAAVWSEVERFFAELAVKAER